MTRRAMCLTGPYSLRLPEGSFITATQLKAPYTGGAHMTHSHNLEIGTLGNRGRCYYSMLPRPAILCSRVPRYLSVEGRRFAFSGRRARDGEVGLEWSRGVPSRRGRNGATRSADYRSWPSFRVAPKRGYG